MRHEPAILEILRSVDEATASEIAERLNVHTTRNIALGTVVDVLRRLERFGSVQLIGERAGSGRGQPAKVWRAT